MDLVTRHILNHISSRVPRPLLDGDRWRIENNFFGPYLLTGTFAGASIVFGGRSGLLGLELAHRNPGQRVFIVERDATLREAISESSDNLGTTNLVVAAAPDECLELALSSNPALGLVCLESDWFGRGLLHRLAQSAQIETLVGEFHEWMANPLWLHRQSRRMSQRFHWHNVALNLPMSGKAFDGPDVSVVVPAYGIENYIDQCVESLVSQTLEDIDIIIVDDGAKDRSGQLADEWARRDARVRVIHQPNAGCAAARSNGLKAAKGMFVGLVDGDDWVDPPMFQALAESAVRYTSDIAQCGYRHCYDSDGTWLDEPEHFSLTHRLGEGNGLIDNPRGLIPGRPTIWRRIYRHDFLTDHGIDFPTAIRRFDDLLFHFMTLALAERLSVVNACYYNYRQQRPGQDIGVVDERLNVHFPIFRVLKEFVHQHHSRDLEDKLIMAQVASHQWALSVIERDLAKDYRLAAKYDIFGDSVTLTDREILDVIRSHNRRQAWWARSILRQTGSGENAWGNVRDYAK